MYKVFKNGQLIANADLPSLKTDIKGYPIAAMVTLLETHNVGEFGLQDVLDPWPTTSGKRGAIFEAEDHVIYELVEQ